MLLEFPERPRESPPAAGLARTVRRAPRPPDRGLVVALIHAHNEQDRIGKAIRSLDEQSSPPDLTIVCADNCSDRTALSAQAAGADVFVTVGNEHGRTGALNQVLDLLLPLLRDDDAVLILDVDPSLEPDFRGRGPPAPDEWRRRGRGRLHRSRRGRARRLDQGHALRSLRPRAESPGRKRRRSSTGRATLFSVECLWNVVMARLGRPPPRRRLERLQHRSRSHRTAS